MRATTLSDGLQTGARALQSFPVIRAGGLLVLLHSLLVGVLVLLSRLFQLFSLRNPRGQRSGIATSLLDEIHFLTGGRQISLGYVPLRTGLKVGNLLLFLLLLLVARPANLFPTCCRNCSASGFLGPSSPIIWSRRPAALVRLV